MAPAIRPNPAGSTSRTACRGPCRRHLQRHQRLSSTAARSISWRTPSDADGAQQGAARPRQRLCARSLPYHRRPEAQSVRLGRARCRMRLWCFCARGWTHACIRPDGANGPAARPTPCRRPYSPNMLPGPGPDDPATREPPSYQLTKEQAAAWARKPWAGADGWRP